MCIPAYVAYVPYLCKLKQLVFCHLLNNAVALSLAEKKAVLLSPAHDGPRFSLI